MTATVPAVLAWPLLASMALVVILRYLFFNHSQWERYLNHALAFMFAANLIRQVPGQDAHSSGGSVTTAAVLHFSLVLMMFATAEFMGFIAVWNRLSAQDVHRRQRRHRLAALLLSAAFLVAATPARNAGHTLQEHGGWPSIVAWALYVSLPLVVDVQLLSLCVKELREREATRNERLVAAGGLLFGLSITANSSQIVGLAVLEECGVLASKHYQIAVYPYLFFAQSAGGMLLAALPLALAVSTLAGYDVVSRRWRRLQPLREGMLAAVPSVAYDLETSNLRRRRSTLDLHQTSVQIRDAILALRPYFRDVPPSVAERFVGEHGIPPKRRQDAADALQLAYAVGARAAGGLPSPVDYGVIFRSRSTTLDAETSELLRLARWWPAAAAAAERSRWHEAELSASGSGSAETA